MLFFDATKKMTLKKIKNTIPDFDNYTQNFHFRFWWGKQLWLFPCLSSCGSLLSWNRSYGAVLIGQVSPWQQLPLISTHVRCTAPHSRKNLAQLGCTSQGYHRAIFLQRNSSINIASDLSSCLCNVTVFGNCAAVDYELFLHMWHLTIPSLTAAGGLWEAQAVICSFEVSFCRTRFSFCCMLFVTRINKMPLRKNLYEQFSFRLA